MRAMVLAGPGQPLRETRLDDPLPGLGQVLLEVRACGVCRTDLHVVDGELPAPGHAVIPGHEIVGTVALPGEGVTRFRLGERVGVPWLGFACGECRYCRAGRENLCDSAGFTGYTLPGGYADRVVADARFGFPIPGRYSDAEAAPLLCAGLIGYRALRMAGDARRLGLYGFGAAAHLVAQVALAQGRAVYAFTRPGDTAAEAWRARSAPSGQAAVTRCRRYGSTRRCCSRPWERSRPPRCARSTRTAWWSASAST